MYSVDRYHTKCMPAEQLLQALQGAQTVRRTPPLMLLYHTPINHSIQQELVFTYSETGHMLAVQLNLNTLTEFSSCINPSQYARH